MVYLLAGVFVSIALHELGHCFVAMRSGCRVKEILLIFPIGGVARMERMPTRPRDEALMAAAGPAVSLFLFAALFFGGGQMPLAPVELGGKTVTLAGLDLNIIQILGLANLVLLVFNLIPAFPMDGGRILRAWLTHRMGRLRATFVASLMGKAGAVVLLLIGIVAWRQWNIWTLPVIAVFLYFLAGQEYRAIEQQEGLKAFGFDPSGRPGGNEWADRVVIGPPPYRKTEKPTTATPIIREHGRGRFHAP